MSTNLIWGATRQQLDAETARRMESPKVWHPNRGMVPMDMLNLSETQQVFIEYGVANEDELRRLVLRRMANKR